MLKYIALLTLFCTPLASSAQGFDYNKEKAYFEVNHNGATAYSTSIKSTGNDFTQAEINSITEAMSAKEGIFELIRTEENYIKVSHLSYVELETIKSFLVEYHPKFVFAETTEYDF